VQHEGIDVGAELGHQERHPLHHESQLERTAGHLFAAADALIAPRQSEETSVSSTEKPLERQPERGEPAPGVVRLNKTHRDVRVQGAEERIVPTVIGNNGNRRKGLHGIEPRVEIVVGHDALPWAWGRFSGAAAGAAVSCGTRGRGMPFRVCARRAPPGRPNHVRVA
jgi:hypothetical protein